MEEHGTEIGVAESFTEAKEESIVHDAHAEVREESSVEATKTHEEEVSWEEVYARRSLRHACRTM
ncbi:hypothetical protein F2Q70_00022604 [Brassica cretica]|uniref:Uncharacterized protein n=1 Tax=Brassica cretica TaxID=69181 RepID=A0A8S9HFS3_BRACR|nr:hypothetical protein F2Q70_00022604 [Brassica cretica]KAF2555964.1 hypothetical protein F2Q68_00016825 [Brassica cretica]